MFNLTKEGLLNMEKIRISEEYYSEELKNAIKIINMYQDSIDVEDECMISDESISILESNFLVLLNMLEDPTGIIETIFNFDPVYKSRLHKLIITLSLEKMVEEGVIVKILNEEDESKESYYMAVEEYEKTVGKSTGKKKRKQ